MGSWAVGHLTLITNSSVALGAALHHKIKRLSIVHGHQQISHTWKLHTIIAVPWTRQQSRDGESLWVTFQPLPFFELVSYRQSSYTPRPVAAETTIGAPHRHTTFIIILIQPTQVRGEDLFLAPPPTSKWKHQNNSRNHSIATADKIYVMLPTENVPPSSRRSTGRVHKKL